MTGQSGNSGRKFAELPAVSESVIGWEFRYFEFKFPSTTKSSGKTAPANPKHAAKTRRDAGKDKRKDIIVHVERLEKGAVKKDVEH